MRMHCMKLARDGTVLVGLQEAGPRHMPRYHLCAVGNARAYVDTCRDNYFATLQVRVQATRKTRLAADRSQGIKGKKP
jgi:hypothetical protein